MKDVTVRNAKNYPMAARRRIVVIGLIASLCLVFAFIVFRTVSLDEPNYQGKSLTYWLERLPVAFVNSNTVSKAFAVTFALVGPAGTFTGSELVAMKRDAEAAIDSIGTNCLPMLLTRIEAKDSVFKRIELKVIRWAQRRKWIGGVNIPNTELRRGQALTALLRF